MFDIAAIPDFALGFATCGGLLAVAVGLRKLWPPVKSSFASAETAVYADYKNAVAAVHAKVNALADAAGKAVNTVRGDIVSVRSELESAKARIAALETAVGVQPEQEAATPTVSSVA